MQPQPQESAAADTVPSSNTTATSTATQTPTRQNSPNEEVVGASPEASSEEALRHRVDWQLQDLQDLQDQESDQRSSRPAASNRSQADADDDDVIDDDQDDHHHDEEEEEEEEEDEESSSEQELTIHGSPLGAAVTFATAGVGPQPSGFSSAPWRQMAASVGRHRRSWQVFRRPTAGGRLRSLRRHSAEGGGTADGQATRKPLAFSGSVERNSVPIGAGIRDLAVAQLRGAKAAVAAGAAGVIQTVRVPKALFDRQLNAECRLAATTASAVAAATAEAAAAAAAAAIAASSRRRATWASTSRRQA